MDKQLKPSQKHIYYMLKIGVVEAVGLLLRESMFMSSANTMYGIQVFQFFFSSKQRLP